jgi:phospholipid/cholesterol/gamma-HCH transport system ATP-binding protein
MSVDLEVAIRIRDLTKTYGTHSILDNINLDIYRQKITTILGFSGAGKSTLLKHILGLSRPTNGGIEVLGKEITKLKSLELRSFRRNFGMVFQYAALFDSLTTFENVAFPLREFTQDKENIIHEKVTHLLTSVGLDERSYQKFPSELSGGMRKRVGLARALALSPAIMLYDEPTTGLDPITSHMVNDLIVQTASAHKERQLTSVIISHDVKASLKISDFIAFLANGKIVEYLPVADFVKTKNPVVQEFLSLC